jgi:hypothetical protein
MMLVDIGRNLFLNDSMTLVITLSEPIAMIVDVIGHVMASIASSRTLSSHSNNQANNGW